MNIDDGWFKALGAFFLSLLAGTLGWRGISSVRHQNAKETRESRFEDNLQSRHDAALRRIDELQAQLLEARDGKALLTRQLREQIRKTMNLLEVMDPDERKRVERWVKDVSSFAPFDSGSGRRGG